LEAHLPADMRSTDTPAVLGIIRKATSVLARNADAAALHAEIKSSRKIVDKQAWMKGRVVKKIARWNLCYANTSQEPNYAQKQGRVVAFSDVPELQHVRNELGRLFGDEFSGLLAELNYYYDTGAVGDVTASAAAAGSGGSTGIGYHGDAERTKVVGLRVGAAMNLQYQWFFKSAPIGEPLAVTLHDGDCYIMSSKSVGGDFMRKVVPTLRHSAGAIKFTTHSKKASKK
jgi:hypothetical protein